MTMSNAEQGSGGGFWSDVEQTYCDHLTPTWDEIEAEEEVLLTGSVPVEAASAEESREKVEQMDEGELRTHLSKYSRSTAEVYDLD